MVISTSLVSGFILAPIKMIIEPIMTFIPSKIGINSTPFDNIVTAISGAHEPKTMDFCCLVSDANIDSKK